FRGDDDDSITSPRSPDTGRGRVAQHGDALHVIGVDGIDVPFVRKVIHHDQWGFIRFNGGYPTYADVRSRSTSGIDELYARGDAFQPLEDIGTHAPVEQFVVYMDKRTRRPLLGHFIV